MTLRYLYIFFDLTSTSRHFQGRCAVYSLHYVYFKTLVSNYFQIAGINIYLISSLMIKKSVQ